jgi:hypothetical protein
MADSAPADVDGGATGLELTPDTSSVVATADNASQSLEGLEKVDT